MKLIDWTLGWLMDAMRMGACMITIQIAVFLLPGNTPTIND